MKAFFANMNLARWIIILSLLGSIGLGVFGFKLRQQRLDLKQALDTKVPLLAVEILKLSREYTSLAKEASREGLKAQADPQTYIREISARVAVEVGQIDIGTPNPTTPARGVIDRKFVIRPSSRDRAEQRLRIANFCYILEKESRRVKVTRIHLDPEQKNLKPHEISNDLWRWEIDVTSRQKDPDADQG